jgi:hypothetical protein
MTVKKPVRVPRLGHRLSNCSREDAKWIAAAVSGAFHSSRVAPRSEFYKLLNLAPGAPPGDANGDGGDRAHGRHRPQPAGREPDEPPVGHAMQEKAVSQLANLDLRAAERFREAN